MYKMIRDHIYTYPSPASLSYAWGIGSVLLLILASQVITGIMIAMHYTAHSILAFATIERILRDIPFGWLIRYMHSNGASAFFVAAYIHMLKAIWYGSHNRPRHNTWITGNLSLVLMMLIAFIGYVLPWGQMSYQST